MTGKYAMKDETGQVFLIFEADNLAEAVSFKHQAQRQVYEQTGSDQIFTVAEATPEEVRAHKAAGFIVGK